MSPVIRRLKLYGLNAESYTTQDVLDYQFAKNIRNLSPDVYKKLVTALPVLNLEYGVLCNQLAKHLSLGNLSNIDVIREELIAALMLSDLLEHIHHHYINVPREAKRFQQHQKDIRHLLKQLCACESKVAPLYVEPVDEGLSLSQHIREITLNVNWYRLTFIRSKRVFNIIDTLENVHPQYHELVQGVDKYINPILLLLSFCYFVPRLSTNIILLLKHTLPWGSMSDEEKKLGWFTRLEVQLQRRWFEIGNDSAWITVGLINAFLLTGVLAPAGVYLSLGFFAFDIGMAVLRATIELKRIYDLRSQYLEMLEKEKDDNAIKAILEFQKHLNRRIRFEIIRLGLNVATVTAIFLAMCFAIPALASNPVIPLVGAIWLVAICFVSFILNQILERYRPDENFQKAPGVATLGLFSKNNVKNKPMLSDLKDIPTELNLNI